MVSFTEKGHLVFPLVHLPVVSQVGVGTGRT